MDYIDITTTHVLFFGLMTLRETICACASKSVFEQCNGNRSSTMAALRCGRDKLEELLEYDVQVPSMPGEPVWPVSRSIGKTLDEIIKKSEVALLEAAEMIEPAWSNYELAAFHDVKEFKIRRIKSSRSFIP